MNRRTVTLAALSGAFLGCIVAANYVTTIYPNMPVGFGLTATAGTLFAGATFVLRDSIHDALGIRRAATLRDKVNRSLPLFGLIALGSALSFLLAVTVFRAEQAFLPPGVTPASIAIGSGVAFLLSETADLFAYGPLRQKGYVRAALASNVVGSVVDTLVFLTVAGFGLWAAVPGQLVGKLAVTLAVVVAVAAYRTNRRVVTA